MPPLSGWKSHRALQTKGCGMAQAKAQSMGQSTHFTHAKVAWAPGLQAAADKLAHAKRVARCPKARPSTAWQPRKATLNDHRINRAHARTRRYCRPKTHLARIATPPACQPWWVPHPCTANHHARLLLYLPDQKVVACRFQAWVKPSCTNCGSSTMHLC